MVWSCEKDEGKKTIKEGVQMGTREADQEDVVVRNTTRHEREKRF